MGRRRRPDDSPKLGQDCVHPDDYAAERLAGMHLPSLGHRRIAYLCSWWPQDMAGAHYSVRQREAGLRAALREVSVEPRCPPNYDADEARRLGLVRQWLADPRRRPTGVLCYGDRDAPLLAGAALQLGLRIPEDLSTLLCAEEPYDRMGFRFTTLAVPGAAVGAEAVRMLRRKIEHLDSGLPRRAIPFEFHRGNTTAAPAPAGGTRSA
jgi:LacI family transcriptional regulator